MSGTLARLVLVLALCAVAAAAPLAPKRGVEGAAPWGGYGEIQMLQEWSDPAPAPAPAVTFAPLEKLKGDVATEQTEQDSKIAANLKTIEDSEVKQASTAKSLQDGLDAEVTKRGEEVSKAVDATDTLKTTVKGVEDKVAADTATLSAAVAKLDTAFGAEKTTTQEEFTKAQTAVENERKSSEEEVKNLKTTVDGDMAKLTKDVSDSMKSVESAVKTNSENLTEESDKREKQDAEQAKIMAALNAKVVNLATTVGDMQQGASTDAPAATASTSATGSGSGSGTEVA